MLNSRLSGILLPIPCLPSRFGIGDLGPAAQRFVDFLQAGRQRVWQVLPLNPTEAAFGHSPYHSLSSFALNPLLISPELLAEDGLLEKRALSPRPQFPQGRIAYPEVERLKAPLLAAAVERFRERLPDPGFARFRRAQAAWLEDFACFAAFRAHFRGRAWDRWPAGLRRRDPATLRSLSGALADAIERIEIAQFLLYRQWAQLKDYARDRGVRFFGDLPINAPCDSADVWAHRELFRLGADDRPLAVSGVPPDYFSENGQLWGHPVYRWEAHRRTRYAWWAERIAHHLAVFDHVRIDHFRGLVAYWEVPAGEKTAARGRWVEAPFADFFGEMQRRFVSLPVVAEDLGDITADVREAMRRFGIPGMRVLMFGFSGEPAANPNAAPNIPADCVVYTGTHDNNTVRGWFEKEATAGEKRRLALMAGRGASPRQAPGQMIRLAMLSPARWSIIPVADLLGLGAAARFNTPGTARGNWAWRLTARQHRALPVERLREITTACGRA
jgi:4-alpha-glucanotransferase